MKIKTDWWLMGGIIIFFGVVNIWWLAIDKTPPPWDAAAHIRSVVLVNQWLTGSFGGNLTDLIRAFGGYPPLIYFIGGVWSLIVGVGVGQIAFLNTIFLTVAVLGVYKLTSEVTKNSKVAVLAAIVFSLLPVIGDISRNMLLDLPLLGWVVWGLYFWIKSEDLKNIKYGWGLLVMLILASLTKLNGFLYLAPIELWLLWRARKEKEIWGKLFIGGIIYIVVVGWWWLLNLANIYQYLTGLAGQGEKLTDPMNLLQWQTWIHYFRLFFLHQAGPIVTIVLAVALGFVPKNEENKKLWWWTIAVYVIFTIVKNKDFRFTMPILITAAVWLGWGLREQIHPLRQGSEHPPLTRRVGQWVTGLLLAWMGFNFVENGFGWPIKKPVIVSTPTFLIGDIEWIGFDDYPVRAANRAEWPQKEIIGDLGELSVDIGKKVKILMLINREEINDNNLGMYKEIWGFDVFEPGSVGSRERFRDEEEIRQTIENFDAVLVPDNNYEPAPFYGINLEAYKQARDFVLAGKSGMNLVKTYEVWGGKKLFLFVRK